MAVSLKLWFGILLWWLAAVQADVSHLGYKRYRGERVRLQRLETEPTPYPAAGYRPDREFGLPSGQPLFPLSNQHGSRPFGSSGVNNLGESQSPQLTYGSPQQETRFRPQNQPQTFNTVDEPEEQVFVLKYNQRRQPAAETGFNSFDRPQRTPNNDFNNFAQDQQYDLDEQNTYPSQQTQNGFNNLAESQEPTQQQPQPDLLYGAPNSREQPAGQSARLRQQLVARLQQAQRLEQKQIPQPTATRQRYRQTHSLQGLQTQQRQHFVNAPQTLYSVPAQQLQLQAASQTSHLIARKPARLTDNREETEIETDVKAAETEDIETTTKAGDETTATQNTVAAAVTPAMANTGLVNYYPAAAVGFVQPLNAAAYIAAANYPTAQPFPAAYALGAPFLSQPYAFPAAPAAQLKAW